MVNPIGPSVPLSSTTIVWSAFIDLFGFFGEHHITAVSPVRSVPAVSAVSAVPIVSAVPVLSAIPGRRGCC